MNPENSVTPADIHDFETQVDVYPYIRTAKGFKLNRNSKEDPQWLCNFAARITANIIRDDGDEETPYVEVEAQLGTRQETFVISRTEFFAVRRWAINHLGAKAAVIPGYLHEDHVASAIQLCSGDVPTRRQITHTGWRKFGNKWFFLHAGLANCRVNVSGNGNEFPQLTANPAGIPACKPSLDNGLGDSCRVCRVSEDVEVVLEGGLELVELPALAPGDDLRALIQKTLGVLDAAAYEQMAPLFCTVFRSVLGPMDSGVQYYGPSGVFKSEIVAIGQQFFGPRFNARNLLGNWASTGNSLAALLHDAKDIMIVLDDYAPTGSVTDGKLAAAAESVFRSQGNGAGRGRARPDGTRRPIRRPRATPISTGEDVPPGYSLQGRMLLVYLDVDWLSGAKLAELQAEARKGTYAKVMRAFVEWLGPQYENVQRGLRAEVEQYRAEFGDLQGHPRHPDILSNLMAGLSKFLMFAEKHGAISEKDADLLFMKIGEALKTTVRRQGKDLRSGDPVQRFRSLIKTALSSGMAHLASKEGTEPYESKTYGWRWFPGAEGGCTRPQGDCIGWVVGGTLGIVPEVYLDPEAAYRIARRAVGTGGEPLTVTMRTLKKRMKGQLKAHDLETRETYTVRRWLQGAQRDVLHVGFDFIFGDDDDEPQQDFLRLLDV